MRFTGLQNEKERKMTRMFFRSSLWGALWAIRGMSELVLSGRRVSEIFWNYRIEETARGYLAEIYRKGIAIIWILIGNNSHTYRSRWRRRK